MTTRATINALDVQTFIVDLLVSKYQVEHLDARPDAVLDDLDIDSMTLMEIELAIEKRFSIAVPDGTLLPSQTIDGAAHTVLTHRRP